jgi:hypothetical protein
MGEQSELLLYPTTVPLAIGESCVLRVADACACVCGVFDLVVSLPARNDRCTSAGRDR